MKSVKILLACLVAILIFSTLAYAEVPRMINYQGKITTPQGALISDTFSMVFSIYADSTGGTALWSETQSSVKVEFGVFSVLLGSINPILATVFDGNTRYLGVKVGSDNEMTPRKAIVSVGYAYHSMTADTAYFAMPDADWSINGDMIYHLNGNVGIGTINPGEKLEVNGSIKLSPDNYIFIGSSVSPGYSALNLKGVGDDGVIESGSHGKIYLQADNSLVLRTWDTAWADRMVIQKYGNVGIGTVNPAYKLDVNGDINVAGSYNVKKGGVNYNHPDYVFQPDYKLMSLEDLKKYVFEHKCLPKVISAEEVKKNNGFKMDELLIQMLEKIEEQTLYIFQLEQRITELEKQKQ